MTILNCPRCGGTHYGSNGCPYIEAPCSVCGKLTILACSDCSIDSGGKRSVHVCSNSGCRDVHERQHSGSGTVNYGATVNEQTTALPVTNKMITAAISAAQNACWSDHSGRDQMRLALLAALRHLPYGWQIVPKEPTKEMVEAGLQTTAAWRDFSGSAITVNRKKMTVRYKAMIAVAPLPTLQDKGEQ